MQCQKVSLLCLHLREGCSLLFFTSLCHAFPLLLVSSSFTQSLSNNTRAVWVHDPFSSAFILPLLLVSLFFHFIRDFNPHPKIPNPLYSQHTKDVVTQSVFAVLVKTLKAETLKVKEKEKN